MGLGNTFEMFDENLVNQRKRYEEKCVKEKIEKPVIVYQNSIGDERDERFASIEKARKYLEDIIPEEFSVSLDDKSETAYDIEVTVKLKKRNG